MGNLVGIVVGGLKRCGLEGGVVKTEIGLNDGREKRDASGGRM